MIITKVSWQHIKDILHQALLLAPEQRVRFLPLLGEESLLTRDGHFMGTPDT